MSKNKVRVVGDLEAWRPMSYKSIPSIPYGMYEISNKGRLRRKPFIKYGRNASGVFSFKSEGFILKPRITGDGYTSYSISYKIGNKKYKHTIMAHRAVAYAFVCSSPDKDFQVNHINGDKTDNSPENLGWVSCRDNVLHSYRTGLASNKGDRHPQARFSNECIRRIRVMVNLGICKRKDVCDCFNVEKSTVGKIMSRGHYGGVI